MRQSASEPLEVRRLLTGDFVSVAAHGGSGSESGFAVATDASGNVYVSGTFEGTVDFDPGVGVANLVSVGDRDIFVMKSDRSGNLLWAKRMGGSGSDAGYGIAVDQSGGVHITGSFTGTADFNPGPGTANLVSAGGFDGFVCRLSSTGDYIWAKRIGGNISNDDGYGIAVDGAGNVFTTGRFTGTVDFDPGLGTSNLSGQGGYDAFVLSLNSSGDYLWAKRFGGSQNDVGLAIAVDDLGNIYSTGYFRDDSSFDPGLGPFVMLTSVGGDDAFVCNWNRDGGVVWVKQFGGSENEQGNAIAVDGSDNVYTTGSFEGTVDFNPGSATASLASAGAVDVFVSCLDGSGGYVWARRLGGSGAEDATGIAMDSAGNVLVAGLFGVSADFDPGTGAAILTSAGATDAFVSCLDREGKYIWAHRFGGTGADNASDIAVDGSGSILATGRFNGIADFDPGIGTVNLASAGSGDVFVLKLSPDMRYVSDPAADEALRLLRNGTRLELWSSKISSPGQSVLVDTHPLAAIRSVRITGSNAPSHSLSIDFGAGGSFVIDQGIHYSPGTGASDRLQLIGVGNEGFIYRPSASAVGTGGFQAYGGLVSFTGVESVAVTGVQALSVEPQGSSDLLAVEAATGFRGATGATISGTSGGVPVVPITFDNIRDLTIDTGLYDTALNKSHDAVTFKSSSYETRGLTNVSVRTGKGNDSLTVEGPGIGLPGVDGRFWFLGGADVDRLTATGDTNWDLNDTRLVSAGGGKILHDDIETATIIGGAGRNHLNASQFSGDVTLDGAGNNDLLRGGAGHDILFGGIGNDRILGGDGDDTIYGQDGNDLLWGEAGEDVIRGSGGNDQIWGGDDNDWMNGDAGNDLVYGGAGDDVVRGGADNDRLFGDAGNDICVGDGGVDLYDLQGSGNSEDLQLVRQSATSAQFRRKPRGLTSILEQDVVTMDAIDEFLISALDGDDLITIDNLFTQLGSVDGGNGTDTCTGPAEWVKISC